MSRNEEDLFSPFGDFGIIEGPETVNGGAGPSAGNGGTRGTPAPTPRPLIPISCCLDDGTGRCAESSQCVEYLTTDGLCPFVDDTSFDEGGAAAVGLIVQLIPCDRNAPPPPTPAPTPEPRSEIVSVFCGPTSGFEECVRYDVSVPQGSDTSPATLCSLVSVNVGRTLVPCDPTERVTTANRYRIRILPGTQGGRVETTIDQFFDEGEVVNIRAVPARGNTFISWTTSTGEVFSTEAITAFTVTNNLSLFANFSQPDEPAPPPPPTPTPPPPAPSVTWRNCIDGSINEGSPPVGYRIASYRGAGGGVCWEPTTEIGFNPSPNSANFVYQRSSGQFPTPFEFYVENPSFGASYKVTFNTNTDFFVVTPREINIDPQSRVKVNIELKRTKIDELGDGLTNFDLQVDIVET